MTDPAPDPKKSKAQQKDEAQAALRRSMLLLREYFDEIDIHVHHDVEGSRIYMHAEHPIPAKPKDDE